MAYYMAPLSLLHLDEQRERGVAGPGGVLNSAAKGR